MLSLTTKYILCFKIVQNFTSYLKVLLRTIKYYPVLLPTTKYYSVLIRLIITTRKSSSVSNLWNAKPNGTTTFMVAGVSWEDAIFAKKVESTRASLTTIKSYCSDIVVEQLCLDPILLRWWMGRQRWRRRDSGRDFEQSKIKYYKQDKTIK